MPRNSMTSKTSFEEFAEGWQGRQEHYLDELLTAKATIHEAQDDAYLKDLISRVLAHYEQFYEEKSKAIKRNVFFIFSSSWQTPFEQTFQWITGFKPGLVCKLAAELDNLSEEQSGSLKKVINDTKLEERELNDEYAKIQESLAIPPVVDQAREAGKQLLGRGNGEQSGVPGVLRAKLEELVMAADTLRTNTVLKVVGILSPAQSVKFLAAATQFEMKIRNYGLEKKQETSGK